MQDSDRDKDEKMNTKNYKGGRGDLSKTMTLLCAPFLGANSYIIWL